MRSPEIINHNGQSIFFMDFSNIREISEIKQLIDKSVEYIRSQPDSSLLTLTNIEGMHFNAEIKNMFSDFVSGNKPHVKTGAVIGLNGLQRIVYNGLMKITGRNIRSFDNINVAKDWLATSN